MAALLVTVAPAAVGQEKGGAVEKELKQLQGKWKVDSIEVNGKNLVPPAWMTMSTVTIDGTRWTVGPGKIDEFTFKIDPTKSPKTWDRVRQGEGGAEVIDPCIYKLDGDTLTICGRPMGRKGKNPAVKPEGVGKRPKEFKSSASEWIFVYKRVTE